MGPLDRKTYTLDNLADALLDAEEYREAAEPLRDYYVPRGEAFKRAFGLLVPADETWPHRQRILGKQVDDTVGAMRSFKSPTSGWLNIPSEGSELYKLFEIAARFAPEVARASADLERVLRRMLMALLEDLILPERRTVTGRDLVENGFDPAAESPDLFDFL